MIKELTETEMNELKPYNYELKLAVYGGVACGLSLSVKRKIYGIFNRITGESESNYGCPDCYMKVLKTVGKKYLDYTPTTQKTIKNNAKKTKKNVGKDDEKATEQ